MTRLAGLALLLAAALLAAPSAALADTGDSSHISAPEANVGQQVTLTLDVAAPANAAVEVDPANPSWNGVEVVRLVRDDTRPASGGVIHTLQLVVAPFVVGQQSFVPAVNVTVDGVVQPRSLPPVSWNVLSTLHPGDPLELSPLAPPAAIAGAQSPFLVPAVVLGGILVLALLSVASVALARRVRRSRPVPAPGGEPPALPGLDGLELELHRDPVRAYRRLGATVRHVLADRYGFPAHALTTVELHERMESEGVDRWQARLVTGLLEECDAVVYAGYRPATERATADLNMAREIVEARPLAAEATP